MHVKSFKRIKITKAYYMLCMKFLARLGPTTINDMACVFEDVLGNVADRLNMALYIFGR